MTFYIQSTSLTTSSALSFQPGDVFRIDPGATVTDTASYGFTNTATNFELIVNGALSVHQLMAGGGPLKFWVNPGGSVTMDAMFPYLAGYVDFNNAGTVSGQINPSAGGSVGNSGTITSAHGPVISSDGLLQLYNVGTIRATEDGVAAIQTMTKGLGGTVQMTNDTGGLIVGGISADNLYVRNFGQITGSLTAGAYSASVVNWGHIMGSITSNAVTAHGTPSTIIVNSGAIDGSITATSEPLVLSNTGTIGGAVLAAGGTVVYDGGGSIAGPITFGDGAGSRYFGGAVGATVKGGSGDDVFLSGTGNDVLNGGGGNNFLAAGAGNDTLTGGSGYNAFSFQGHYGQDVITDFKTNGYGDHFEFVNVSSADISTQIYNQTFYNYAQVMAHSMQVGANVVITSNNSYFPNETITIIGVTLASLTPDHFIFTTLSMN